MRMEMTTANRRFFGAPALAVLTILSVTAPAMGQTGPAPETDAVAELLRARGEAYHRAPDDAQDPAELRATRALNAEIASRNDLAANQEQADRDSFDAAQARHEQDMAIAEADRARHDADVRAAEDARLRYERDLADWEATVRACEAGDRARCMAGSMPPRMSYE